MKMNFPFRAFLIVALSAGVLAGWATQQSAPQASGPTEAELEAQRAQAAADRAARENQQYMSQASQLMGDANSFTGLNDDQKARMADAEAAIANNEGRRAYEILSGLVSELRAAKMTYTVSSGDSLWRIAGKSEVYGNAYQWPLIYKQNASKIRDADLIYPGQDFDINKSPSRAEVDAAVAHARNRGAWSVGEEEASDKAYLSR